ncbi:set domain-containing protein 5 [Colletotrichum kahawae]|uniref:Set domain-containing protein 5 n=1 Tax=Colletotrichum kahawae TaxID=34407 RepID=A0AAD9YSY0_COLKA|nr:set domain-containing protein 5 [Colletotrichum kahawae]
MRRIARGTRLLAETPIFRVPRDESNLQKLEAAIARSVGFLSQVQRESFFALSNFHGTRHSKALGIARTNALPLGSGASEGGIFLEASRINHSCRHNAQNTWNDNRDQPTIHVLKDIDNGEEITISYLGASENYAARQSRLQKSFGFVCACELCTIPAPQRTQSDRRLDRITYLDKQIGNGIRIVSTPLACFRMAHEMKLLMEEEGIADARVPRLYYDALQIVIANGDEARARVFAERASAERLIMEGSDSAVVHRLNKYAADPSSHVLYGTSEQWRQGVNKIPQGLNEQDFERWLWRLPT